MRAALLVALALPLAACGSRSHALQPSTPSPSTGRPGPPPAWIETKAGSRWLGYSSSCWTVRNGNESTGSCADFLAPKCGQPGVPNLQLQAGETVRAHLGYSPTEASVDVSAATLRGRIVEWRVTGPGGFTLFTRAADGDASYVGCGVFGSGSPPAIQKCSRESGASLPKGRNRCGSLP
jgi:hypothetical protein